MENILIAGITEEEYHNLLEREHKKELDRVTEKLDRVTEELDRANEELDRVTESVKAEDVDAFIEKFGMPLEDVCGALGISVDDYLAAKNAK